MSELKINKSEGMSDHAMQFEVDKLQKSISSIEANIADIKEEYDKQMSELAEEKNYDPWFYAGIVFGAFWFIYKLFTATFFMAFVSFVFLGILSGLFYTYKKFLHKENRVVEINEDYYKRLKEQEELLAKRQAELGKYEG